MRMWIFQINFYCIWFAGSTSYFKRLMECDTQPLIVVVLSCPTILLYEHLGTLVIRMWTQNGQCYDTLFISLYEAKSFIYT